MEAAEPKTLQEAILYFASPANCRTYLVARRWPNGVVCPRCGSQQVAFLEKYNRWQCSAPHAARQFTSKTGTIFEDSPISLDKWLLAMWQVVNCKNGVSSYEIHRAIGVTQKTAWFMDHRIRLALGMGPGPKFTGEVEADETFVGGKTINMHKSKREKLKADGHKRRSVLGKAIVSGLLERNTKQARVKVMPNTRAYHPRTNIIENVERGSVIYSDALRSYRNVDVDGYIHEFIDHTEEYVRGAVHTNGLENFGSCSNGRLKGPTFRWNHSTFNRYCDEQAWRYNNRKMTDGERLSEAVKGVIGKRLTYEQLIGKIERTHERLDEIPMTDAIAIYAIGNEWSHFAKFSNGYWSIKLGETHDVSRINSSDLAIRDYGAVVKILSRPHP